MKAPSTLLLAADPRAWIPRILAHCGLSLEPGTLEPHKQARVVKTASVVQVCDPISTTRIGRGAAYPAFAEAFRAAYTPGR